MSLGPIGNVSFATSTITEHNNSFTAMDLSKKKDLTYSISNIMRCSEPTKTTSTMASPNLTSRQPEPYNSSPHIIIPTLSPSLPRIVTPPSETLTGSSMTLLNINTAQSRAITPPQESPNSMAIQRPFKAFTQNKLFDMSDVMVDLDSNPEYIAFRKALLTNQQKNNRTNTNMRRNIAMGKFDNNKDPEYLEKRRRNNIAAKKSRDARRNKEDELAVRCAFLEKENNKLRFYVQHLEQRLQGFPYVM